MPEPDDAPTPPIRPNQAREDEPADQGDASRERAMEEDLIGVE